MVTRCRCSRSLRLRDGGIRATPEPDGHYCRGTAGLAGVFPWQADRRAWQPCRVTGPVSPRGGRSGARAADVNGTLTLHAEAVGPSGTRKIIEVTVARTSSTEIERGQIAQRGQEELNQRSRKAAVQTPGKKLTNMRMNTSTGNLVVQ